MPKYIYLIDEILIRLKINVFVEELKLDIVLNLFNSEQSAVVASNIFHADQPNLMLIKGEHSIDCEIPSNFLNKHSHVFFLKKLFNDF